MSLPTRTGDKARAASACASASSFAAAAPFRFLFPPAAATASSSSSTSIPSARRMCGTRSFSAMSAASSWSLCARAPAHGVQRTAASRDACVGPTRANAVAAAAENAHHVSSFALAAATIAAPAKSSDGASAPARGSRRIAATAASARASPDGSEDPGAATLAE